MSAAPMPDQAEPATAENIAFELAGVLAALMLNIRAIGEAAHAGDVPRLVPALTEAVALEAEGRAALLRFHGWVESAS